MQILTYLLLEKVHTHTHTFSLFNWLIMHGNPG